MPALTDALAVFDIGKTNIKLSLVDRHGRELAARRCANRVVHDGLYPHHDVAAIEAWLLRSLRELSAQAPIRAIVPVTHGATAVLIDAHGPVLPVSDYEQDFVSATAPAYASLRPQFADSASPALDHGLNLGRQLHWLQQRYPQQFARARHLLMYPQYWAWRLCGVAAAEVTSLGCHTDLWDVARADYSALVTACGWQALMPPLRPAWAVLGQLRPALAQETGLTPQCQILCGVHDSNASLLRYLYSDPAEPIGPRVVLSTGTWVIAAALDGDLRHLQEHRDMLANVSVQGRAVPSMRFMGGREFAQLAGPEPEVCSVSDLQALIEAGVMALPCFADCGGPFAGRHGSVHGSMPATSPRRYALATLYCVLMTDYCLQQLAAVGNLVVEGSFNANPYFGPLLAGTMPGRTVYRSQDGSGTTMGGWMLGHWGASSAPSLHLPRLQAFDPLQLAGWDGYRQAWQAAISQWPEVCLSQYC
jgi:sugar (pentulose or hexulose) kinase